jgi:tetratricopeptide (TPR) repeat protein
MSDKGEDELIALVSSEQRGFRRILFAGFGILFVLVAMSAALGVYYYSVANSLEATSARLERNAFDSRLAADRQTNQVANLERAVRRTYDEFRAASASAPKQSKSAAAIEAVGAYLQRGAHSLNDELLIESASLNRAGAAPETHALLVGAAALLAWDRSGEQIAADATGLPDILANAKAAFEKAGTDSKLASLAKTGLAWILFIDASSNRSTYALADCEAVFRAIEASAVGSEPGPQPLYWRAQCERKLGRTREALRDYALALRQSGEIADASRDEAALTLAMNAFHGVGTELIATFDIPDETLRAELDLAVSLCGKVEGGKAEETQKGSPRMLLARSCLDQAIRLRERLHQTNNQVSGTAENVSFSYLRDGDFDGAYENAAAVERTGLFAWNELVRALSAKHVATPAARKAARDARRNVSFFATGRFNPCELQVLLNADLFAEAQSIVEAEHSGEPLVCAASQVAEGSAPPKP